MALLWTDGFDRFGVTADLTAAAAGAYSSSGSSGSGWSFQSAAGKNGGGALRMQSNAFGVTRTVNGTLSSGAGVHFACWVKFASIFNDRFFGIGTNLQSSANTSSTPTLGLVSDGSIRVTEHGNAAILATSPANMIQAATYYHFEYSAKYNAVGGFIKVWINGNLVINFSGATSSNGTPTTFNDLRFWGDGSTNVDFDDLIVWDDSGTDFAPAQLASAYLPTIETLSVNGDDTVTWTRSTGSVNANNVDDPAFHNSDTDYNSSTTIGQEDLFTVADPASTPAITFAVSLKTVWKIQTTGTVNLRHQIKVGTTTSYSADYAQGTGYSLAINFWGLNPDTIAAWGTTDVASLKCGYKYQS